MIFDNSVVFLPLSIHPAHKLIKDIFLIDADSKPLALSEIMLITDKNHKEIQDVFFYNKDKAASFSYTDIFEMIKNLYIFSNRYINELTYHENIVLRSKFLSRIGTPLNKHILKNEILKESYLIRMTLLGRTDKMSEADWNLISSILNITCREIDGFEEVPKDNRKRKYLCKMNVAEAVDKVSDFIFINYSKKDFVYVDEKKIIPRIKIYLSGR